MVNRFSINKNNFLVKEITGYFHQYYTGYGQPDNPEFINVLKNTFNSKAHSNLISARNKVTDILVHDIPEIIKETSMSNCLCVGVPRAKALETYSVNQLMLRDAIRIAVNSIHGAIDGTGCIVRYKNTMTTHLSRAAKEGRISNDGDEPYPGITVNTCRIDSNRIMGQNIILIDDIYTKHVNIDEDCIQALIDNGAHEIIFYALGYTRRAQ